MPWATHLEKGSLDPLVLDQPATAQVPDELLVGRAGAPPRHGGQRIVLQVAASDVSEITAQRRGEEGEEAQDVMLEGSHLRFRQGKIRPLSKLARQRWRQSLPRGVKRELCCLWRVKCLAMMVLARLDSLCS